MCGEPEVGKPSADAIPHVGKRARENFAAYLYANPHKAFAIAPGGAWSWEADAVSQGDAAEQALDNCQSNTRQKCILYAVDNDIVFNEARWPTLWGPYASGKMAHQVDTGTRVGQRFYNLQWWDKAGNPGTLVGLQGKVVLLHFWGSWCPPCMREFPSLVGLHGQLLDRFGGDVEMVLLQLREPFSESLQWTRSMGFAGLPTYDSGTLNDETTTLTLANGDTVQDRVLARVFPSSYVLDRNGVVVFSHYGPITDWEEYLPFFTHLVAETAAGPKAK